MDTDSNLSSFHDEISKISSYHLSEIGRIWKEIGYPEDSEKYQEKISEIDYNKEMFTQIFS